MNSKCCWSKWRVRVRLLVFWQWSLIFKVGEKRCVTVLTGHQSITGMNMCIFAFEFFCQYFLFVCFVVFDFIFCVTCPPILRYVRILGNAVHAIQIKTKLCQLVEVMMERRDDLSFCQEMKFRSVTPAHTFTSLWLLPANLTTLPLGPKTRVQHYFFPF